MNPFLAGMLSIPMVLILLALRVHVGIALGITGFLGFYSITGDFSISMGLLTTTPYNTVANFAFTVLPLFILMGSLAGHAGIAEDAYRAAQKWVARLPGGLAIATTLGNAAFGAASGASIAACAVFTKFSLPEMKANGYQPEFGAAAICAAGALAMLIPPSVLMIIYGIMTEESIGALFLGGVFPGLLLTALLSIGIVTMVKANPKLVSQESLDASSSWREKLFSLRGVWGVAVLMVLVLGGIYAGVFSPTEAGAAAAFGAFVICLASRKLTWVTMRDSLLDAARTTAMIFFVVIGAIIYSKFLAVSGMTQSFVSLVMSSNLPPLFILIAFMVLYLGLGCLLDSISMMTITLPLVMPVSVTMGWDPIWFGVLVIVAIEAGLVTPPLGITIYTVKAVAGPELKLESLFRSVLPFLCIHLMMLAILIAFPKIVTWLPDLMLN